MSSLLKKIQGIAGSEIYPDSVHQYEDVIFFITNGGSRKYLCLYFEDPGSKTAKIFEGGVIEPENSAKYILKKCTLNTSNRKALQSIFGFTNAVTLGLVNSFGFGDRLGIANPAHVRSLNESKFKPVLAQQSIRELTRTNRTPEEVMDAAVWAVFQEGYHEGFGADADHLKTTDDIDLMVQNGFRMFTFDPGEYVHNEADLLEDEDIDTLVKAQDWKGLSTTYSSLVSEYADRKIVINDLFSIKADENNLKRALIKYGDALVHIKKMYDHLKEQYPSYVSEAEVSVDETDSVTSPFEHYFIANELKRLQVDLISLAPRFIGEFEKGIDYKGDLNLFKKEYIKHISIAEYFGTYKLSLHSGSDKFGVYNVIGSLKRGVTHIKTAGTSYLEALKVIAIKDPTMFRQILAYSRDIYATEKESYHVSADLAKVTSADSYTDEELISLFTSEDARQILHVTFGRILTDKDESGKHIFKEKIMECLNNNEELHYKLLVDHFHKHLDPFK